MTPPAPPVDAHHRGRLLRKYLLLILSLVSAALLVSGGISIYFGYREASASLASLQKEKAIGAASRIEQYIRQVTQQVQYAALPQIDAGDMELRRIELIKLLRQAQEVTDIALIGADGRELIARVPAGHEHARLRQGPFRRTGVQAGPARPAVVWAGLLSQGDRTVHDPGGALGRGQLAGIVAELNLKFIWDVVSRIKIGERGKAYVVGRDGFLVADPDIGLVLRKTNMAALEHVRAAGDGAAGDEPAMLSHDLDGHRVLASVAVIEPLGWKVFVEQPVTEVYARLNSTIVWTGALLLAGLAASALAASALARSMVRPIRTLDEGARRIGAGELDQRIDVRTNDELEGLAEQFNRMSAQLRESYAGLERKVDERTAELSAALERQTATAGILKVISESPTDVQPVFEAIVTAGVPLFNGAAVAVCQPDGNLVQLRAIAEGDAGLASGFRARFPFPLTRDYMHSAAILEGRLVDVPDVEQAPAQFEAGAGNFLASGYRAVTVAPMVRGTQAIGAISVVRVQPGPLSERQLGLLTTFADQAVIAIENVRLFNETKDALEQQTATAEILRVISGSPTDVQPVFDAIVRSAQRLLGGKTVVLVMPQGSLLVAVAAASDGTDMGSAAAVKPWPLDHGSGAGACILDAQLIAVADTQEGRGSFPRMPDLAVALGYRSALFVPLLRDDRAIGALAVLRAATGEFGAKEIALARTFADQAVIAIENVRLFNETQGSARAADRDGRDAERDQQLGDRHRAGVRDDHGQLRPPVQRRLAVHAARRRRPAAAAGRAAQLRPPSC